MVEDIPRQAWLALTVSTLVTFLVVIDITALNVAFPSIRDDLGASEAELGWVISGYNVIVGALLLAAGRMADSLGRKKVFLPGVALFAVGSALCGIAWSAPSLIAFRLIQAAGGAVVTASSFAVMLPEFPASRRSTAIGIAGATGALGAVVGPALGSVLIEAFSWRAIFWINVPLCALVLFLGPRLLNESKDPNATGRIDVVGVLIGTTGVALAMFGIVQSEQWGFGDPRVWALTFVGLALLPALVVRSRSHPEPLLDLELFSFRSFSSATAGVSLYSLAFISGAFVNSLLLQDLWNQDLSVVGAAFVPSPLLAVLVSPPTGRLADRIGHRWVLGIGCLLCALSYSGYLLFLGEEPSVWTRFVPLSLITGVGIGMTVATWSSAGLSDMPMAKFGVAGGTANTIRQAATALGISVCIAIIASGPGRLSIVSYQRTWIWIVGCYVLAAITVMLTFPSGNSRDRAA